MARFERLIRFKSDAGNVHYGEAPLSDPVAGQVVSVYDGNEPWDLKLSNRTARVAKVLCPLDFTPIIYGIGLNYKKHIKETGLPAPEYPTVFTKPSGALNGPFNEILFPDEAWNMDYEGELCVVIGKDCKDIGENGEPLDYVLGYACGNDASARFWQVPDRSGHQHGYAKSFDGFAPLGPVLVSPHVIPHLGQLTLTTRVNGEERQKISIGDLLFDVGSLVRHLSRGTTIKRGTVIMTGTPGGVAAFMNPPQWLRDGDQVEVEISRLGKLRNTYRLTSTT
ncbi:fumarylacetoacetate hydrolase family protein [Pyrenochaeta sp. MPI-SDFR-AT-0127]|nr:fumarylacetoacetate hydrolase family protein [Pyrenochaeta sp. MPI-SDFR-AT-0127]